MACMKALKTFATLLVATAVLCNSPISNAESKFAIAGVGATSCGQFLKPRTGEKKLSDMLIVYWIQGYLSGTNTQRFVDSKTPMKLQPDSESIIAFVDKFCRDNPLMNVYQAALELDQSF